MRFRLSYVFLRDKMGANYLRYCYRYFFFGKEERKTKRKRKEKKRLIDLKSTRRR